MLHYQRLNYGDPASYHVLSRTLEGLRRSHSTPFNTLFYLAVPPSLYCTIVEGLGKAGMTSKEGTRCPWTRLAVEKPFGRDLQSAKALNETLHRWFSEEQIFRMDHYLAKETVQNILILRFANSIFEPLWNRNFIDYVGILASEDVGVGRRGGYYEEAGVIRDMFQNHMMQLLALIAMEPPSLFEADRVRDEKVKVFRSLKPIEWGDGDGDLILGQYSSGEVDGERVPAYREEEGVSGRSLTPTFAAIRVYVDNWRWRGVPFFLVSGKRMARKLTTIVIQFKEVPHSVFKGLLEEHILANRLTLGIHPTEGISLAFQAKGLGARICLQTVTMDFQYQDPLGVRGFEAYEKALVDCMMGDQMLFWRQDGLEECWAFFTPVLEECEGCPDREERLHLYPAGSWGPHAAREWIQRILHYAG
jgi:glucose-6-phosphate 1-dehydrogenase